MTKAEMIERIIQRIDTPLTNKSVYVRLVRQGLNKMNITELGALDTLLQFDKP